MRMLLKGFLYVGIVVAGAFLAVDNIPSLKATVLEVVNPRVQERELVRTLQQNLEELSAVLPADGRSAGAIGATTRKSEELIVESQELLRKIADINDQNDGVVDGIVAKVADTILGTPAPSIAPTISSGNTTTPCTP